MFCPHQVSLLEIKGQSIHRKIWPLRGRHRAVCLRRARPPAAFFVSNSTRWDWTRDKGLLTRLSVACSLILSPAPSITSFLSLCPPFSMDLWGFALLPDRRLRQWALHLLLHVGEPRGHGTAPSKMRTAKWLKGECPLTVGGGQEPFLSLGRAKCSSWERFCQLVPSAPQAALGPTGQARPLAARLAHCSPSWSLVSVLLLCWMCFCRTASTPWGPSRI